MKTKLFISYASEDKETVAKPIALTLINHGYSVWYDEYSLKVGDSLFSAIDKGLLECNYGIVILSKYFFNKGWTKHELRGLVSREIESETKFILPIWHEVSANDVKEFSPTLVDKIALNTNQGIENVVNSIINTIGAPSIENQISKMVQNIGLDIFTDENGLFFPVRYYRSGIEGRNFLINEFEKLYDKHAKTLYQIDLAVGVLIQCISQEDNQYLRERLIEMKRICEYDQRLLYEEQEEDSDD